MRPGSKTWKKFMSKLYGIGAAIVIIGALFKIMHWPLADMMLILGLGTEAVIFFFSAFEPVHDEYDWSLVYPELALGKDMTDDEMNELIESKGSRSSYNSNRGGNGGGIVSQELDKMLEEAKIDSNLIQSLGDGMRKLSETANKISDVADATKVSAEYTESLKKASEKVSILADSYTKASESVMGLADSQKDGASFGEQMQKVTLNLKSLNEVYEMQLKGASESLENTQRVQSSISELMTNLADSVDDTRSYKKNISELSTNLSSLNKVYGNMLRAMNVNQN